MIIFSSSFLARRQTGQQPTQFVQHNRLTRGIGVQLAAGIAHRHTDKTTGRGTHDIGLGRQPSASTGADIIRRDQRNGGVDPRQDEFKILHVVARAVGHAWEIHIQPNTLRQVRCARRDQGSRQYGR